MNQATEQIARQYAAANINKKQWDGLGIINVKDHGAKGDGDTDDTAAIQAAVDYAYANKCEVHAPAGTYYLSAPIRTRNEKIGYANKITIKFTGAGRSTIFTRNDSGASGADYTNGDTLLNQSVFAIHNSNDIFEDFSISGAKVGIYIGQDNRDTPLPTNIQNRTHTHINRFSKIWMNNVGTGILFKVGYGAYYNTFEKIHMISMQIGIHFATPYDPSETFVANRNSFKDVRIANSWVGVLAENGDTNTLDTINFEGIQGGSLSPYAAPSTDLIHDGKATALYLSKKTIGAKAFSSSLFNIINNVAEACTRDVYYNAYAHNFINNYFNLQTKFERGSGALGTFIGTAEGDYGQGFHLGIFHVNYSGQQLNDQPVGIYSDYEFFDERYSFKYQNLSSASAQIGTVSSDTYSRYKALGKVKEWWIKSLFTLEAGALTTDQIKITVPMPVHNDLKGYAFRPPLYFPVITQLNAIVIAKFDHLTDSIIIPAPASGWSTAALGNAIDMNVRWY